MSVEQLISHFKECRDRFTEMRTDPVFLPLHCAILRGEGERGDDAGGFDFARILGQRPRWSSNHAYNPTDWTFALAFYLDSGEETPERIKKAVDAADSVAKEALRLLSRLPPEVQERLALDKSYSWWCVVFRLAWHFCNQLYLKAGRGRLLTKDGQTFDACWETHVQQYGANNRRDLMPGLIYSYLEHDIRVSSEAAIDLIISVLSSCPKKRAPISTFHGQNLLLPIIHKNQSGAELSEEEKQELTALLAERDKFQANSDNAIVRSLSDERRANFRQLRIEFESVALHLAEENKLDHPLSNRYCTIDCKIMKFVDSFTSPPATEWAEFTEVGPWRKVLKLLSRHDAEQEWLQIWGPFTDSFIEMATRASEALPDDVPNHPILWSWNGCELSQRPVMERGGPVERWVGFVFWVLKERSPESIRIAWYKNDGHWKNGLATLDRDLFAASVLAIDLAGILTPSTLSEQLALKQQLAESERDLELLQLSFAIAKLDQPHRDRADQLWRAADGLYQTIESWRAWHINKTIRKPKPPGWQGSWPPENADCPAALQVKGKMYVQNLFGLSAPIPFFANKKEAEIVAMLPAEPQGPTDREKDKQFLEGLRTKLKELEPLLQDLADLMTRLETDPMAVLMAIDSMAAQAVGNGVGAKARGGRKDDAEKAKKAARDKKADARDKWIYGQCCNMIAHDTIVANLKKIAVQKGWKIVSTKQRIRQIGNEYAERNGLSLPPPRQNKL